MWDGHTYRRALLVDGGPLQLAVSQVGGTERPQLEVVLEASSVGSSAEAAAHSALARLLGLDLDLSGFYARAVRDGLLNELAQRYRGLKPPRFPTVFECLLNAVSCQQLSIAAGLTILSRLAAVVGVILNLTVWFALQVLFGRVGEWRIGLLHVSTPDPATLNLNALALSLLAAVLLFALHRGVLTTLAICSAAAVAAFMMGL